MSHRSGESADEGDHSVMGSAAFSGMEGPGSDFDTGFEISEKIDSGEDVQQGTLQMGEERCRSFMNSFGHIQPAPLPDPEDYSDEQRFQIPESYRRHWEKTTDTLKTIAVNMKATPGACMTPRPEDEGKMYSESKSFSVMRAESLDHLVSPYNGMTYCFVAECLSEIPAVCLKTLFFFDNCRKVLQSQDRSPFVFPTDKIGLMVR